MKIRELRRILSKNQTNQLVKIALLQVLSTLMEVASISSLLPIFYFMVKEGVDKNISVNILGLSIDYSIFSALIIIFILFSIRYLISVLIIKKQSNFIYQIRESISNKILDSYIQKTYEENLSKKTSDLIRDINVTTEQFCFNILNPALLIAADLLIGLGVIGVLFFVSPAISFFAILYLSLIGFLMVWNTRKILLNLGEKKEILEGARIHNAIEAFRGLREIKIYAAEGGVLKKFGIINNEASLVAMREMYIRQLPRFYLEAAVISGLLIYIGFSVSLSYSGDQILAILGIFGIALLRLLPSVNRIVVSFQNIRYALPSLENLTQILGDIDNSNFRKKSAIRFMESIELINVVFNYPGTHTSALGPINLKIIRGDSIAIVGKSGSGKTTLLNIILGLLTPKSGAILIDGFEAEHYMLDPKKVGYVAQHSFITNDSLLENIAFYRDINATFLESALTVAHLNDVMKQKKDAHIGEDGNGLSGGERQRLAIARALAAKPEILILDEFSSALDRVTEKAVIDSIESADAANTTKIIVTHKLDSSFKCNKIIHLSDGLIVK
jgi:ABC-type multidrug transport system fused ATPase/permease subunit